MTMLLFIIFIVAYFLAAAVLESIMWWLVLAYVVIAKISGYVTNIIQRRRQIEPPSKTEANQLTSRQHLLTKLEHWYILSLLNAAQASLDNGCEKFLIGGTSIQGVDVYNFLVYASRGKFGIYKDIEATLQSEYLAVTGVDQYDSRHKLAIDANTLLTRCKLLLDQQGVQPQG